MTSPVNTDPVDVSCTRYVPPVVVDRLPDGSFETDALLSSTYSPGSLTVANAYGLIDELELQAFTDFIDCKEQQLVKIRTHLGEKNAHQNDRLTKAAIITGGIAAAAVAAILISDDESLKEGDTLDWIGVAAGVSATVLAVISGRVNRTALLHHERNLIAAVWGEDDPKGIFPESVWYLLNQPQAREPEDVTIRDEIIEDWNSSPVIFGKPENLDHLPVLIGSEGTYDTSMLLLRLDMLADIEGGVDRLHLALYRLHREMMQ